LRRRWSSRTRGEFLLPQDALACAALPLETQSLLFPGKLIRIIFVCIRRKSGRLIETIKRASEDGSRRCAVAVLKRGERGKAGDQEFYFPRVFFDGLADQLKTPSTNPCPPIETVLKVLTRSLKAGINCAPAVIANPLA
jgi:hypothetical protein